MKRRQRATAVRPQEFEARKIIAPVDGGFGERNEGACDGPSDEGGAKAEWEELADKCDQVEKKVKEHLEDQQDLGVIDPPIINAPPKMPKEEWEKHQVTHTICPELQTLYSSEGSEIQTPEDEKAQTSCARCGRQS